jgi:sigma-B regulation protein RsbU (phosphoserine phosphatase)
VVNPSPLGIGQLMMGGLIATLGLLALVISLLGRRRVDPLLASFGALTLLWGVRLFFGTPAVGSFGVSRLTASWVDSTITYVINIPGWIFFRQLLGRGWRSIIIWWIRLWCVFASIGILSDLISQRPGTLTGTPNNLIVIAGFLPLVGTLWHERARMSEEARLLGLGLSVFALLAINDNLVGMDLLPWRWRLEGGGFLFLLGCLGLIATRRFFANQAQLAGLESELKTARSIQMSILPSELPAIEDLSVAVRFRPTSEVAGDIYDFLEVGGRGLGVVLADVSGHGVPAALIASMVKVAVASQRDKVTRPAELLAGVNRVLCGNFQRGFVTATYAWIDPTRGELTVANAGHPDPLLRPAHDDSVDEVGGRGAILGRFAAAGFQEQTVALEPGDRLVLYTDGVTEARSPDGEMFGEERLRSFIGRREIARPEEFCDALLGELGRWSGAAVRLALEDDVTLVVVDFRPGGGR